jgi:4-amino-4-deoxy-L-arabinose transferase-like glycosyltransferase
MMDDSQNIQHKIKQRRKIVIGCMLSAIFILVTTTSRDYGLSWDQPVDLDIAERNVRFAFSLNPAWMNISIPEDFSIDGLHPRFVGRFFTYKSLPFGNILSALSCYLFFEKLGVLGSIQAHRLPNMILFILTLLAVYKLVKRKYDYQTALVSVMAVAFQPQFFAHMQFNSKDFPYACFMAFTLLSTRVAVLKYSWKWLISAAIFFGMAGAIKPSASLIIPIVLVWFIFAFSSMKKVEVKDKKRFWIAVTASPLITVGTYFAVWPYIWVDTANRLSLFLHYYLHLAMSGGSNFQLYRLYIFLSVQPPAMLIFGAVGVAICIYEAVKGVKRELNILLLLWCFLPVIRVALPKTIDYDGVRHYLEYAVPLGIIVGNGFVFSLRRIMGYLSAKTSKKTATFATAFIMAILPLQWAFILLTTHPFEIAYYNFIVGGTKGAQQKWEDATDYWGAGYRQGTNWLNDHAEKGAVIIVPICAWTVSATQSMWMRDDLILATRGEKLIEQDRAELAKYFLSHKNPIYIMYITRRSWYPPIIPALEAIATPVHQFTIDGAPIIKIFKVDPFDRKTMAKIGLAENAP